PFQGRDQGIGAGPAGGVQQRPGAACAQQQGKGRQHDHRGGGARPGQVAEGSGQQRRQGQLGGGASGQAPGGSLQEAGHPDQQRLQAPGQQNHAGDGQEGHPETEVQGRQGAGGQGPARGRTQQVEGGHRPPQHRKSTRLNS